MLLIVLLEINIKTNAQLIDIIKKILTVQLNRIQETADFGKPLTLGRLRNTVTEYCYDFGHVGSRKKNLSCSGLLQDISLL